MALRVLQDTFDVRAVRFAFAYGSKVMKQASADTSNSMLDLMLVVDGDPVQSFHPTHINKYPYHYSWLCRHAPTNVLKRIQEVGAGVMFNTDVKLGGMQRAKYGVVGWDRFHRDLQHWDTLYLAGRMQKPIQLVHGEWKDVEKAQRQNLVAALHAALLMLPERFTTHELLVSIVSISYLGIYIL